MRRAELAHFGLLATLFGLGIVLLLLAASWFVHSESTSDSTNSNWMGTAALLIVAASNIGLALFGRKNAGVLAATVISAFWTVSASVAFSSQHHSWEAWTLLASSVLQVVCAAGSYLLAPRSSPLLDPEGYLPPHYFAQTHNPLYQHHHNHLQQQPTSYGALSHFVDPLSSSLGGGGGGGGQPRTSSVSSSIGSASSPSTTASSSIKRVPSPFGSHKFALLPPVSAATMPHSAADELQEEEEDHV